MDKTYKIFLNACPILLMVGLIPLIKNDLFLAVAYMLIIVGSFRIKLEKNELTIFTFGFFIMIFFEFIFISTGVEVFYRNTLFGLMPLWLPLLWAYGFVAIKRSTDVLNQR